LESFRRCPRLFAYQKLLGFKFPATDPLLRGSLVHIALAHYYARLRAYQLGQDPEAFYAPQEAMRLGAVQLDAEFNTSKATKLLPDYLPVPVQYEQTFGMEQLKVVGVEHLISVTIGGYPFTQRLDLVVEDRAGRIWFWDHKCAGHPDRRRTVARYSLSSQFLAMQFLGPKLYGDQFGGVRINFVSEAKGGGFRFERLSPNAVPHAVACWRDNVVRTEEQIAEFTRKFQPWDFPMTTSDLVCVHSYGPCAAYPLCQHGPSGLAEALTPQD